MCTSTSITLLVTTATVCASPLLEMAKFKRSELAKIALIAALVLIAPLLSTSMRPPFLYLLLNLLIIFLGAESGILKAFSSPPDEKKPMAAAPVATAEASSGKSGELSVVEKPVVEKNAAVVKAHKVKKCPSMPSLLVYWQRIVAKSGEWFTPIIRSPDHLCPFESQQMVETVDQTQRIETSGCPGFEPRVCHIFPLVRASFALEWKVSHLPSSAWI